MLLRQTGSLIVVLVGVCALVQAGQASTQLRKPVVARITGSVVGHEAHGTKAGDLEITRLRLYRERIATKAIGRAQLLCVYLGAPALKNCTGSYALPPGKIVVGGTIGVTNSYELAVLGGTGLFDNVQGTLTMAPLGKRPASFLLVFRLAV